MPNVRALDASFNSFVIIELHDLQGLPALRELNLSSCLIRSITPNAFSGIRKLQFLDLTNNYLTTIHVDAFFGVKYLQKLYVRKNNISLTPENAIVFKELSLHLVEADEQSRLCCAFLHQNIPCKPTIDVKKCHYDIISQLSLNALTVMIGVCVATLNITVILYHFIKRKSPLRMGLISLAFANLLISPYEISLYISDAKLSQILFLQMETWAHSYLCTFQSFITTLAQMMNSLSCLLISLETYKGVTRMEKSNIRSTMYLKNACLLSWIGSIGISSLVALQVPAVNLKSVCCLPLLLTVQNIAFSVFTVKFTTELISYIGTFIFYISLILRVKASRMEIQTHISYMESHRQRKLVIYFITFLISNTCLILTDILVTIFGIVDSYDSMFSELPFLIATFVLPIHSVANPLLHTIFTKPFIRSLGWLFSNINIP